ncbi:hypothetical protein PFISCL1PPCAC_25990, partial [Pristionchus fissidentatus]
LPSISATTAQICLEEERMRRHLIRKGPDYEKMKKLMAADPQKEVGFHLICYNDKKEYAETEDYFYTSLHSSGFPGKVMALIWAAIPEKYSKIIVNGTTYPRDAKVYFDNTGLPIPHVVKVEAYRDC